MPPSRESIQNRGDEDEVCPVCKSSRYLNPDMHFLINPECYHKMCESCVDRIFSSGPANCPVAGCHKTLRKNKFRKQTFEDIHVEREVDIRRRVMQILNRREEEFDSKRAWDDFLEQREEIIANLVHGTDVAKTESDLQKYAQENMRSIRTNQALEAEEASSFQERQTQEQERARLRRQAIRQEYENERREILAGREDVLTRLAAGRPSDAAAIAREGQKVLLKKSSARRSEEERIRQKQAALRSSDARKAGQGRLPTDKAGDAGDTGLIKGLKRIKTPEPEKPYDPFGGMAPGKRDYYTLQDFYPSSYLDPIRQDTRMQAGGYDLREYYSRTLLEAFAGLGCFVDEEVSQRDATNTLDTPEPVASEGAAMAATSSGPAGSV
ncbi:TFIIH/NER complex subunit [Aspergillus alliaceus]|uniref:RNA polymerase II transcription factor B subunit 3 n=1 Tax=Petromyces alliaceus TaxID=209559 RepID=A0A5N6GEJ5_PETAA|nr:CDK-activating kinase assembly factor MAT1 [Aspergillus alliaceus]KAB8239600.1 CDK-activating kinase assembly factor MAT1 [Aspergillus alliaceus]KAE8394755.1 CDK-activating kinase assembly factor MAT1 [Aspergillus alliaceus]KAF5856400.1 TFIIH/NER complex subunit [Aspergillus burnettii]